MDAPTAIVILVASITVIAGGGAYFWTRKNVREIDAFRADGGSAF
jgi:hypothetical protein